ncbi:uncharacterized protein PODANS_5_50 [Podospora anserina S mat+]|uniref:Podospora anserina S mat+ genomic DNA chromosome 5, supercontig 1 n=1 Tax=Podospora anserina (strain S / ATCC MYA-4624 / DSM 980 / FGSC 10383) TaxID=515849 RepID=B2AFA4_PODAN|nr:uncharacterized protein PODANS_5_50 [Podospora anserina S mat+]CAP62122.1 unnamed protein product [Podospora anserina S mat+]CDP29197.1 Putative protein of unknown function [Podospora anserina S mat+]
MILYTPVTKNRATQWTPVFTNLKTPLTTRLAKLLLPMHSPTHKNPTPPKPRRPALSPINVLFVESPTGGNVILSSSTLHHASSESSLADTPPTNSKHMNNHTKRRQCPFRDCEGGGAETKDLNRHLWTHHPEYASAENIPKDEEWCGFQGCGYHGRRDNVKRHRDNHNHWPSA